MVSDLREAVTMLSKRLNRGPSLHQIRRLILGPTIEHTTGIRKEAIKYLIFLDSD